jgi:phytol kinase
MNQTYYALAFLIAYIGVISIMEYLHRYHNVKADNTRKMAHAAAAVSSLLFLLAFDSFWYVFVLGIIFFLIFWFGRKYNILKSMEPVGRKTSGTYLLPMSVFLIFLISKQLDNPIYFALPVLIVGISDPLAGFFGINYRHRTRGIDIFGLKFEKTVLGSAVFFVSAFAVSLPVLYYFGFTGSLLFQLTVYVTLLSTTVEMVSEKGIDNITVPLAVIALLYFFVTV